MNIINRNPKYYILNEDKNNNINAVNNKGIVN